MAKTINILIHGLDDDESVRMLLEEQMELNGVNNFRMFSDPEEFLKHLNAKPHICIIDYLLPGELTGLGITRIVIDQNSECKVIMMSGLKDFIVLRDFFRAGGFDWVDKDESHFQDELVKVVQKAISFIKAKLEFQQEIDEMREESRVRKKRKSLPNETTND